MNKIVKIVVIFLVIDIVVIGAYFGWRALRPKPAQDLAEVYEWAAVDEYTMPSSNLMEYIKSDASEKGILPVEVRNYGRNAALLKKFRGAKFVGPKVSVVEMTYKGLADWALVDLRTKNDQDQDIQRTVLYILFDEKWMIGDTGRLVD